jgi:hypothetical protein
MNLLFSHITFMSLYFYLWNAITLIIYLSLDLPLLKHKSGFYHKYAY